MFSLLYFAVMFIQMISARVGILPCASSDDCADGYSCHIGMCTKCLKCNLLLRKGSDCVIDFNECGECLMGYERVLITDSSNAIKPCKPVTLKEKLNGQECANDSACPPNYYCHELSCVKCFDCSLVNRLSPVGNCPKLLNDCGSCMNGFEEVPITLNTNLKLCERQTITVMPEISNAVAFGNIGSVCMVILVLIAVTATIFIKKPKVKILTKSQCPELPSAPPLYIMDMPQPIKKLEERESEVALTIEHKQQAKVFKQPDALYYYIEDEAQGSDTDLENGAQNSILNLWAPTISTEPDGEMLHSSGIFVNNYIEQGAGISVTDSPQLPNEISGSSISVNELDDNQLRDFSADVADSNNSHQEKNPSN